MSILLLILDMDTLQRLEVRRQLCILIIKIRYIQSFQEQFMLFFQCYKISSKSKLLNVKMLLNMLISAYNHRTLYAYNHSTNHHVRQ